MRLGRSSSVCSARASGAALFDRTNAPRARQPGAAWGSLGAPGRPQPARPGRPGRAWTVSPGWRREGLPAAVAGATKNKLRRRRMGVISPPRFFLRFFLRRARMRCGQGFFLRTRSQGRREGDLACLSHYLTAAARDKTAMTSLRWLAVLDVPSKYTRARQAARASS